MWTLATSILGILPAKLWVTYFAGDTIAVWEDVGISANPLIGLGSKDNCWIQGGMQHLLGSFRKCGPNTELFYDSEEDSMPVV